MNGLRNLGYAIAELKIIPKYIHFCWLYTSNLLTSGHSLTVVSCSMSVILTPDLKVAVSKCRYTISEV